VGEPDDVVFQLYTSGTTGVPKGVLTTNGNLAGFGRVSDAWRVDAESVFMVAMPLFHIGGTGAFLVAFMQGARTILIRAIVPEELLETMESERISNGFLVPTVLQMLCAVPGAADRDWSALRSIAYGASSITTTTLKAVLETFKCPLFQLYGLTETTGAIVQLEAADHEREHLLRSAGRPYPWMQLKVVDPSTGEERPVGEVGEVRVKGPAVMAGYFERPAETEAAFVDGWLCTGDGGYLDSEGYLFLTDRIKDMIVTGAENVYPIEVEEALASHPGVGEVAVIGIPDERWGERVTAVIVPRGAGELDADELVAYARERLAGYKLPRNVFFTEALPKTASGKVLKRDLRQTYS
jgi:long-chain acyl-CoA synthetase